MSQHFNTIIYFVIFSIFLSCERPSSDASLSNQSQTTIDSVSVLLFKSEMKGEIWAVQKDTLPNERLYTFDWNTYNNEQGWKLDNNDNIIPEGQHQLRLVNDSLSFIYPNEYYQKKYTAYHHPFQNMTFNIGKAPDDFIQVSTDTYQKLQAILNTQNSLIIFPSDFRNNDYQYCMNCPDYMHELYFNLDLTLEDYQIEKK